MIINNKSLKIRYLKMRFFPEDRFTWAVDINKKKVYYNNGIYDGWKEIIGEDVADYEDDDITMEIYPLEVIKRAKCLLKAD